MLYIILFIAVVVIVVITISKKNQNEKKEVRYPYVRKKALFTKTEMKFYKELKEVVKGKYEIFGQVRMEDLINVEKGTERKKAYGFRGRIKSRHIDFVLCNPEDSSIVTAIELDDPSHNNLKAMKNDAFKDKAFKDAGLPLIRFKTKKSYSEEIINKLSEQIGFKRNQIELPMKMDKKTTCPKCSAEMIKRIANKGKHKGKNFLACSKYPVCKTILPV